MTANATERADVLQSFVDHPGWALFSGHAQNEWGAGGSTYHTALDKALNLLDDSAAASQARQVRAARRAIEQILQWPVEELARLKRAGQESAPTMGRRGVL